MVKGALSHAARRVSAAGKGLTDGYGGGDGRLGHWIRYLGDGIEQADQTAARGALREYHLRSGGLGPEGEVRGGPIGVALLPGVPAVHSKWEARMANSAYFGLLVIEKRPIDSPLGFLLRRVAGLGAKPTAKWMPSPLYRSAVQEGNQPVVVSLHHGSGGFEVQVMDEGVPVRFGSVVPEENYRAIQMGPEELAERLQQNKFLATTLDARKRSDIWLLACDCGEREAQVVADAFGRTTHTPTGYVVVVHPQELEYARQSHVIEGRVGDDFLEFRVDDAAFDAMDRSLASAPSHLQTLAAQRGWSATAIWPRFDPVTGEFMAPVVTAHPSTKLSPS